MKKLLKNLSLLSILSGITIYGIDRILDGASQSRHLLPTHKGSFFSWKYGDIFYTQQGEGTPILLIHDFHPASSSMEWSQLVKYLSKDHLVYSIDLLGCGRSDRPAITYTNYMYVQLIQDFITSVIKKRTDLVATGDSASFSIMSAHMNKDIIGKIFLIHPGSLERFARSSSTLNHFSKNLLELPLLGSFLYHILYSEKKIQDLFVSRYFFKHSNEISRYQNYYYESCHASHNKGRFLAASILSNYTGIPIQLALKKIENPIYIISSRDYEDSRKTIESYLALDEQIESVWMDHCRKLPQLEEAEKLSKCILHFYH